MASKNDILETLALLASKALESGEEALAADLNRVIADHDGTPAAAPAVEPAPAPVAEAQPAPAVEAPAVEEEQVDPVDVAPLESEDDEDEAVTGQPHPAVNPFEDLTMDDLDAFNGLVGQVNAVGADAMRAATPRSITLAISGPAPAPADMVTEITAGVLPSLVEVLGELEVGETTIGEDATTVVLNLPETNDGQMLAVASGDLGLNVFEADWPVGEDTYRIAALAAPIEDLDLARQLGLAPDAEFEMPEVPEGQHPINGALTLAEEALGFRPEAAALWVVYRRHGGPDEVAPALTEEQVQRIVAHPISQGGLRRLGNLALLGVEPGETADVQVACFGILDAGEIDPATLAVGAAAYRGTFNFGGDIGEVTANAETTLVEAHVEV